MGDRNPPMKPDEQYPLLKVDGGGDISHAQLGQTVVTAGFTHTKNRFSRWPEFVSACWMTLIICGISFLVFHALGIGFYQRQPFVVIMKCNTSKPASSVFYHQIVPRGSKIPFVLYTEYLANIATQYPLLHYNIFFLIDDAYPDQRGPKRMIYDWYHFYKIDEIEKDAYIFDFQRKYQNVNVTIMPLSKYMTSMPILKYKWRVIPQSYLPFYLRVFSVWQNGGIGIDLRTFNNDYHNHLSVSDPRIEAILRQHNDGINIAAYTKALTIIDDEANALFSMFTGLINHFLNESRSFLNRTLLLPAVTDDKSPVRTHRSKRQTNDESDNAAVIPANNDPKNFYKVDETLNIIPTNYTNDNNLSVEASKNTTTDPTENKLANKTYLNSSRNLGNGSETHQLVLLYDFSYLNTGPSLPPFFVQKPSTASKPVSHILSIDPEGIFIAATSARHPLLIKVISGGCIMLPPKFLIQDALINLCSKKLDDACCNNIYVL